MYPVFVVRGVPFDEVILAKRCLSVARVPLRSWVPTCVPFGTEYGGLESDSLLAPALSQVVVRLERSSIDYGTDHGSLESRCVR